MAKRKSAIDKALETLSRDRRVLRAWSEGDNGCDGYRPGFVEDVWVDLRPGFISELGTHSLHEDTPATLIAALAGVEPCDCESCAALTAKGLVRP